MKLRVTIPFAFAFVVFCLLDDTGLFTTFLTVAAIHEIGHLLMLLIVKAKVHEISLELTGAAIFYDSGTIGYLEEAAVAAAGPAAGLLAAFAGAWLGYTTFAGTSFLLSAVNLLPAAPLDGGRLLAAVYGKMGWSEQSLKVIHVCSSVSLLLLGCYVFRVTGGNFTCMLLAIWLLLGNKKNAG